MKFTSTGFRIGKNGKINKGVEQGAITSVIYLGQMIKKNGVYYFYERKQGCTYVYIP